MQNQIIGHLNGKRITKHEKYEHKQFKNMDMFHFETKSTLGERVYLNEEGGMQEMEVEVFFRFCYLDQIGSVGVPLI